MAKPLVPLTNETSLNFNQLKPSSCKARPPIGTCQAEFRSDERGIRAKPAQPAFRSPKDSLPPVAPKNES